MGKEPGAYDSDFGEHTRAPECEPIARETEGLREIGVSKLRKVVKGASGVFNEAGAPRKEAETLRSGGDGGSQGGATRTRKETKDMQPAGRNGCTQVGR